MTTQCFSLGLIGHPLEHSLSPLLHRTALQDQSLPGDYLLYDIQPLPAGQAQLAALFSKMRAAEIQGLNVTIPHKQAVIPFMDQLTPAASAVGAVNTVQCRGNCLVGDNTDGLGFMADLKRHMPDGSLVNQKMDRAALVMGAGGAARAVVYALAVSGWKVWLAARRLEQANALIADLKANSSQKSLEINSIAFDKNAVQSVAAHCQLIVNATPLGMYPNINSNPWPEDVSYPKKVFIYDLVYNPAETVLLRQARQAGSSAANGAGMLVEQAALAFEIWTGRPAPKEKMQQVMLASLRNKS
ncbi:MAG: shikimate dehydrogenase [Anaerolineaceae bacterium]|nr:shikimate dehydrogenase [Anaerolineaceae bacterium]